MCIMTDNFNVFVNSMMCVCPSVCEFVRARTALAEGPECTLRCTGQMSRECHPARGHLFGGAGLVCIFAINFNCSYECNWFQFQGVFSGGGKALG